MNNDVVKKLLNKVAGINGKPVGAYNIRVNGKGIERASTANIEIKSKTDVDGINIIVKPNTKNETVHIPVVVDTTGLSDKVYNDFYIGGNSNVSIIAGCGIHNDGQHLTGHDGIHTFYIGKNSKVKYVEKHYGEGKGLGQRILNPITVINLEDGSSLEMETVQIEGVDFTKRETRGNLGKDANLVIKEKLMTSGRQTAQTNFDIILSGENSSADVVSRSVARGESKQVFNSKIVGNSKCKGHSECDAIIMDRGCVTALPALVANNVDASLIHEAAIGKIAGEQITKLMTLGLNEEESEHQIINGFLK